MGVLKEGMERMLEFGLVDLRKEGGERCSYIVTMYNKTTAKSKENINR